MRRAGTWLIVVFVAIAAGCGGGDSAQSTAPAKPAAKSVIVIALEGLRADAVTPDAAPRLAELAAESVQFDQAWAQAPVPAPSLASLLTGLYPTTHGLVDPGDRLVDEAETVAEAAQFGGVATALFAEGLPAGDDLGLGQGFDSVRLGAGSEDAALAWLEGLAKKPYLMVVSGWSAASFDPVPGAEVPDGFTDRLAEVLASRGSDAPIALTDDELAHARAAYRDRVRELDGRVGDFVERLRAAGALDSATLIVAGLNGTALQEHGDLFGESLYPAVTHVPLMIRRPGGEDGPAVSKVVELVDLAPTVAATLGVKLGGMPQGADLAPILEGGGTPPYVAFAETDLGEERRLVVMDGFAMVASGEVRQLFDVGADPLGMMDVSEDYPERVQVLSDHLEAWGKMVAASSLDPDRRSEELDDETLEQLKSLGYIQ